MFSSTVYTYTICIHPINVLYGLLFHFYIVQDDPRFSAIRVTRSLFYM
jgi:hypothetical protein